MQDKLLSQILDHTEHNQIKTRLFFLLGRLAPAVRREEILIKSDWNNAKTTLIYHCLFRGFNVYADFNSVRTCVQALVTFGGPDGVLYEDIRQWFDLRDPVMEFQLYREVIAVHLFQALEDELRFRDRG